MKNTYEKLDKSLNKDWTSFIEKLAKGTNNVEANLIVEKYKKGDSDIPPEAKQYLDSITGGGVRKKFAPEKVTNEVEKNTKDVLHENRVVNNIFYKKNIIYIRNILRNARLAFSNTPFLAVRLTFRLLDTFLDFLLALRLFPPLNPGAGFIAYSYLSGAYTPAPPCPRLFDNIPIS
jgi:hypothetical protein